MKKLILLALAAVIMTGCTHAITECGIVKEVRKERHQFFGNTTEYVIVCRMDYAAFSQNVEIATNTLYNVGDTIVIRKLKKR